MMSLLILNHKVLYLILFICLLCALTSARYNIIVYVQQNGTDQSECMEGNGSIPCHTLSYVLNQINGSDVFNRTDISLYVYITYSQEINNILYIQLPANLHLIGIDNPVLEFNGNRDLTQSNTFYGQFQYNFHLTRLTSIIL